MRPHSLAGLSLGWVLGCGTGPIRLDLPERLGGPETDLIFILDPAEETRGFVMDGETGEGLPAAQLDFAGESARFVVAQYAGPPSELNLTIGPAEPGPEDYSDVVPPNFERLSVATLKGREIMPFAEIAGWPPELANFRVATSIPGDCIQQFRRIGQHALGEYTKDVAFTLPLDEETVFVAQRTVDEDQSPERTGLWYVLKGKDAAVSKTGRLPVHVGSAARLEDGTILASGSCEELFELVVDEASVKAIPVTLTGTAACSDYPREWFNFPRWMAAKGTRQDFEAVYISGSGFVGRIHDRHLEIIHEPPAVAPGADDDLDGRADLILRPDGSYLGGTKVDDRLFRVRDGVFRFEEAPNPGSGLSALAQLSDENLVAGGVGWVAYTTEGGQQWMPPVLIEGNGQPVNAFMPYRSGFLFGTNIGFIGQWVAGHGLCPADQAATASHHVEYMQPWPSDRVLVVTSAPAGKTPTLEVFEAAD